MTRRRPSAADAPARGRGGRPRVLLYTTGRCPYCDRAKALLREWRIPFTEFDVERDRRALAAFRRAGGRGVPLLVIGSHVIPGFAPDEIRRRLRRGGYPV